MPRVHALLLVVVVLQACSGPGWESGASEPITVRDATFHPGPLPHDNVTTPTVVYAAGASAVVTAGNGDIAYNGLATREAFSVAVAFPTVGSGYWVVPVTGPDPTQNGNQLFSLVADFTPEVPYGLQTLSFAAIDGGSRAGPRFDTRLCVLPDAANGNLAACDPEVTPLNAVVSLAWDTDVDLDFVIVTPEGKEVRSKSPTTVLATGTVPSDALADPSTGKLSRDSNGDCAIDGIRVESLVFPGEPPEGDYALYADLWSACGAPAVAFEVALYQRVDADDGTHPVVTTPLGAGQLLALQADAGERLGTFVTTVHLP